MEVIENVLKGIADTITGVVDFIGGIIDFISTYINMLPVEFKSIILILLAFGVGILIYRFVR